MRYYIKDTTLQNGPIKVFLTPDLAVCYMKEMVQRKLGMTYEQYLTHLADLGHFGYDEREFYESLRDTFESGVLRENRQVRCSIYEASVSNEGSD